MDGYIDFFNIYIIGSVEMLFQFYFLSKILKRKVTLPPYFLFTACAVILLDFIPATTILGFSAFVFWLTTWGTLICRADFKSSLLYAALGSEMMLLCYGIMKSLFSILYPLLSAFFHDKTGMIVMLASEAASLILTGICYYMVYRYFSCYTASEIQYMFLLFIPILMIFIMGEYINTIQYGWESVDSVGADRYFFSHGQLLLMQFLGIASLFCNLFAYKKLMQNCRLRTELSLLEQKEHSLNQYVEQAKSHYEKTKSFRHDVRNHIVVLKELLQGGQTEQALHYIADMEDIAEELLFLCRTNNPVVDILVGNKLGIAKGMGIDADCFLRLPYPCGLRDIDICIILSNALDNAIHACKNMDADAEKYIHVSGCIQGDFLMMEVENSYQGSSVFERGTGLSNIKMVAEKYAGAMSVKTQGNVFILHVLLIIPQHSESISRQMDLST